MTFIGIMYKSKKAIKERIWNDYKNQESYRERMQAVVGSQPVFDARNCQVRGKDGQFKPQSRKFVPKNTITVNYLVWSYAVPYQTFMRWKREGFASNQKDTYHKGKSGYGFNICEPNIYSAANVCHICRGHIES
jgi:hypothetical protein